MDRRPRPRPITAATALAGALAALLFSCGGSDNAQALYSRYAAKCALPRPGIDSQGSLDDEKIWLRLWTDDLYLWYREVPADDPAGFPTAVAYFNDLKTTAKTASGSDKDKFHFTFPTDQWLQLSQSGVEAGYGVQWALVQPSAPRDVRAADIEGGSPAATANIARGAKVITVDGAAVVDGDRNVLNAGLFPATVGETHQFSILDPGQTNPRPVTLVSADVQSTPVKNVQPIPGTPTVGYILFNDQIATAEPLLIQAINTLKGANVTELVLDIRYNGGGYLSIASELAFMIAGPTATAGKTFEKLTFNDKHTAFDPVTGQPLTPFPFLGTSQGFTPSTSSGFRLPSLGLQRVFVLTGAGTCSASESIMNGLRGIDVQVIQIGSPTCGKPYGFYPADNCGTTYFSIQFQGVNAKGFGDYADGFVPAGTSVAGVPGCQVADDFGHALGDPAEALLSAALQYAAGQGCPPATTVVAPKATALTAASTGALAGKAPWRQNRILRR
jgi:carboxyl-terminal processing protease